MSLCLEVILPPIAQAYACHHLTACNAVGQSVGVYGDFFFQMKAEKLFYKNTHVRVDEALDGLYLDQHK